MTPSWTVANLLGSLEENPNDEATLQRLQELVPHGEMGCSRDDAMQLLAAARAQANRRGEVRLAVALLELEITLASDDGSRRKALWLQAGRLWLDELLDVEAARRALVAAQAESAGDAEIQQALQQLDDEAGAWRQLVDRSLEQAEGAPDATTQHQALTRAATLLWQYSPERGSGEVDRLFRAAQQREPGNARVARMHAETLRVRGEWEDMAQVLLDAAQTTRSRDEVLSLLRGAARLYAKRLAQPSQAANCYQRVRELARGDEEALQYLVSYYTDREQWQDLTALYEGALRLRQSIEAEQGILVQLGMVHWRMRGAEDEAEPYFARLRKLDPTHPGMLEFYRHHYRGEPGRVRLLPILADAQRLITDAETKLALAIEVAETAQQAEATQERAIDAWKVVQRLQPDNAAAVVALRKLYRQTEKWNALVELLKGQSESCPDVVERVALLREMVDIYRCYLRLDVMVIRTLSAILEIDARDAEAAQELATTYETLGRWSDLIQILTQQAETTAEPSRRIALCLRIADLWVERFANYNKATQPLEQILAVDPTHGQALARLHDIYTKKRAWKPLFDVLQKEIDVAEAGPRALALRKEAATLAGERLQMPEEAIRLWWQVLQSEPGDITALEALEKVAEAQKDWATLVEALERKLQWVVDREDSLRLLQRLGSMYADQLRDRPRAIDVWRRVLRLEPGNTRALRVLREAYAEERDWDAVEALYSEAGDWEGLAEVLSSAAERASTTEEKVALSFRVTAVYEDRLQAPQRAMRSYERILLVDAKNVRAARALIPIYERREKWPRTLELLEVVLRATPSEDVATQQQLLERMYGLCTHKLSDASRAFRHAVQLFELKPQAEEARKRLEESAARAAAHAELARIYLQYLEGAKADDRLHFYARLAHIMLHHLQEPEQAAIYLEEVLRLDPMDQQAAESLADFYETKKKYRELRDLIVSRLAYALDDNDRYARLLELARIEETFLNDSDMAIRRYRDVLNLVPTDLGALRSLLRLLNAAGRWDEVIEVLPRLIELESTDEGVTTLLLQLAMTYLDHVHDGPAAMEIYARILRDDAQQSTALAGLERLHDQFPELRQEAGQLLEDAYRRTQRYRALADLWEKRLASSEEAEGLLGLRVQLADLYELHLADALQAFACLQKVVAQRPDDFVLWDRMQSLTQRTGMDEALAQDYVRALDAPTLSTDDMAELAARAAAIYRHDLDKPEAAEPLLRRLLALRPSDEAAFAALKEMYTQRESWGELQTLYRIRIAAVADPCLKTELLVQICSLYEEFLDDPTAAIRAYLEVLDLQSDHRPARRALARLYRRKQQWRDLVSLLRQEIEQATGQDAVDLRFEVAEVHDHQLADAGLAVDSYESVLQISRTHLRAQQALERLMNEPSQRQRVAAILEPIYEAQGAWSELAQVLHVQLEALRDAADRFPLLVRLGRMLEQKLRQSDKAFEVFAQAVEAQPADAQARQDLERLAEQRGWHRKRAEVLTRVVEQTSQESSPSRSQLALRSQVLAELAHLWHEKEADLVRAEAAYQQLLATDADDTQRVVQVSLALENIHQKTGDYQGWAEDLRRQAKFAASDAQRLECLHRLAVLLESRLQDADAAIAVCQESLLLDADGGDARQAEGSHDPAYDMLERLLESRQRWHDLIETLRARQQTTVSLEAQRRLSMRIASLYEDQLADSDGAVATLEDLAVRFGHQDESLAALARLHSRLQRWHDLLEVMELQLARLVDGKLRADLQLRMAQVAQVQAEQPAKAISLYAEVLRELPHHQGAIAGLEAIMLEGMAQYHPAAAALLVPEYAARQQADKWVAALELASTAESGAPFFEMMTQAADLAQTQLHDEAKAFSLLTRVWQAATAKQLPPLAQRLENLAASLGSWAEYVRLLQDGRRRAIEEDVQADLCLRLGHAAWRHLDDLPTARDQYEEVLRLLPDHPAAMAALEEIYPRCQQFRPLLELLRRRAEVSRDPRQRLELLLRRADIALHSLGDHAAAANAYEQALEESVDVRALRGLEGLYRSVGNWRSLVQLYERQLEMPGVDAAEVTAKLGIVWLDHLDEPASAFDRLKEALRLRPTHGPTIEALERLMQLPAFHGSAAELLEPVYLGRLDWSKLLTTLEARLAQEANLEARKELLQRLAQLQQEYLEDLEAALEACGRLFQEDVYDTDSFERLLRSARVVGRWDRLAQILEQVTQEWTVQDAWSAKLVGTLAQLYDERLQDAPAAIRCYRRVLAYDEADEPTLERLQKVYRREGEYRALVDLLLQQAEQQGDAERRVLLLQRAAEVLQNQLEDIAGAIECHRRTLEIEPGHRLASQSCARLLEQSQRWGELAEHLESCLAIAPNVPEEVALRYRLAGINAEHLSQEAQAIDGYASVLELEANHAPSIAALEQLLPHARDRAAVIELLEPAYRRRDEWQKLIGLLEMQVEVADDAAERYGKLAEIGALHAERGADVELAFDAWRRALLADLRSETARAELWRLATKAEAWPLLIGALRQAAEAAQSDLDLVALFLREVASLYDQRCGDPRAAIGVFHELHALDPEDPTPLDALESLHTLLGEWEGLVDVLQRKAERALDATQRAALYRRIGAVYEEQLALTRQAIDAYHQALSEDEQDALSLEALERLYASTNDDNALAEIIARRMEVEEASTARAAAALRLGDLAERRLMRPSLAIDAYRRALDEQAAQPLAASSLVRLFEQEQRWDDLLQALEMQREHVRSEDERASLWFKAAQIYREKLDDPLEVVRCLRLALTSRPHYEEAVQLLLALTQDADVLLAAAEVLEPWLESRQRWDELAAVLMRKAEVLVNPSDRQVQLRRLAQLHRQRRGDVIGSFNVLRRAFAEDPHELGLLTELEELAGELGAWVELVDTMEACAPSLGDAQVTQVFHQRLAVIAETRLQNVEQAIEVIRRSLDRVGDDEALLGKLQGLFERSERWSDLVDVLERRVGLAASDADRARLLLQAGEIQAQRLQDYAGALRLFREASEASPDDEAVGLALEGLLDRQAQLPDLFDLLADMHRRRRQPEKLIPLYQRRIRDAERPAERSQMLQDLAVVCEQELQQPAAALAALRQAFVLDPRDQILLDEIERVAGAYKLWGELRSMVESLPQLADLEPVLRRDLLLRAASWYRQHLKDAAAAEACLRAALLADATSSEAYEALAGLLRGGTRHRDLVMVLREWSDVESDEMSRVDMLREAAGLAMQTLHEPELALSCYESLLTVADDDVEALQNVHQLYSKAERWREVAASLVRLLELEPSTESRVAMRHQLADLQADKLQNDAGALEVLHDALLDDPLHMPTFAKLERMYERLARWQDLSDVLEQRLEVAATDAERIEVRVRLARLHGQQADGRAEAERQLREILQLQPDHLEASAELQRLMAADERWPELADLLHEHLRTLEATQSTPNKPEAWSETMLRLADINEHQLKDVRAAAELHQRACEEALARADGASLAERISDIAVFQAAAGFYGRTGALEEEIGCLLRLLDAADTDVVLQSAERLLALLDLAQDQGSFPVSTVVNAVLRSSAKHVHSHALRSVGVQMLRRSGDTAQLIQFLQREVDRVATAPEKVFLLKEIAALYQNEMNEPDHAVEFLEKAVRLQPGDREILMPLCDIYILAGRQQEAVPWLEKLIDTHPDRRGRDVAALHHRLGQAYEGMQSTEQALHHYVAAFKIDLTNVHILHDLGKLYYALKDFEKAQKTFRALLLQKLEPQTGISKGDVYYYLGDIAARSGDKPKAIAMLERALAEQKEHQQATTLLGQLRN